MIYFSALIGGSAALYAGRATIEVWKHDEMLQKLKRETKDANDWMEKLGERTNRAREESGYLMRKLDTTIQQEEQILQKVSKSLGGKIIVPLEEQEVIEFQMKKLSEGMTGLLKSLEEIPMEDSIGIE